MTQISEDELNRIERLSGLSLSEGEREILYTDLARIVPYMERISELDIEDAPDQETASGEDLTDQLEEAGEKSVRSEGAVEIVLREDIAGDSGLSEAILSQAPKSADGMFTVPRTVE
ncbi:MAG: aspartyl/glutamyl-tRNA amidotransferase subunit C [Clostridiales bacterium]|nr:aspartyl/glutamyl-tRNA amidotransferase subunit C [Clostridiales bacterium]